MGKRGIETLVGAFVSLGMHLAVSMHFTQSTILVQRMRFVLQSLLRPLLSLTPSLLLCPFWRRFNMVPANPALLALWAVLTLAIIWQVGLTSEDRHSVINGASRLRYWRLENT